MKTFILNLQFIFKPSYWLMNYSYDKRLDEIINRLLDKGEIESIDRYTCNISGVTVWIENYPYAYCHLYNHNGLFRFSRPSRLTIQRLHNAIKKMQIDFEQRQVDEFISQYIH